MFAEAIEAFGVDNIQAIKGKWHGGGDLTSNFDAYKAARADGKSPEAAALDFTFTGHMAKKIWFHRGSCSNGHQQAGGTSLHETPMNTYAMLRQHAVATGDPPHMLAQTLAEMLGRELTQKIVVAGFRRAFPSIPLEVLLEAGAWHRVSDGGMSDAEFDAFLADYIRNDFAQE